MVRPWIGGHCLHKAKGSLWFQRIFSPVKENDVGTFVIAHYNGKLLIAVKESSIQRIIAGFYDRSKGEGALNELLSTRREFHQKSSGMVWQ